MSNKSKEVRLPAEWEPQSFVQLTFPHRETDWADMLDEAMACFVNIASEIVKRQKLLAVCHDLRSVKAALAHLTQDQIIYAKIPTNDTWARDHAFISVFVDGEPTLIDFTFNGWGMKFPANLDNRINARLYVKNIFPKHVGYKSCKRFVLEGGSVESDGAGTILTTKACLMSHNRNNMSRRVIENNLQRHLGAERVLWLKHGYLVGDDTDSHIDTLARFCTPDTIAYVQCDDVGDVHYSELQKMEQELQAFRLKDSVEPYKLIPLPMADAVYDEKGNRLPATYANFLIMNDAVLVPTYASPKDRIALERLQEVFPDREIVGVDCRALIKQHGSLHCVTMQYFKG